VVRKKSRSLRHRPSLSVGTLTRLHHSLVNREVVDQPTPSVPGFGDFER
jgi:hypothetical protein